MSIDDKTNCYRIGLAFIGIAVNNKTAELLWRFADKYQEKGGSMDVSDAVKIQSDVDAGIRAANRKFKFEKRKK